MNKIRQFLAHKPACTASLFALLLLGCGDGGEAPSVSTGTETNRGTTTAEGPSANVQSDEIAMAFTGGRCFMTEDGGSDGGISLDDLTSEDGAELSMDWAGDSRMYAMVSINLADGREFSSVSLAPNQEPLAVEISGSSATVTTNLREIMVAGSEPFATTIEVRCP